MAVAIRLALKGHNVTIFEANSSLGGKIGQIQKNGFRFDTGPSLFTMPGLVDDLFLKARKNPRDYFSYHKLNLVTKYFFPDKVQIDAFAKSSEFGKEVQQKLNVSPNVIDNYLNHAGDVFNSTKEAFLDSEINGFGSMFKLSNFPLLTKISKLGVFNTLHDFNKKQLAEPHLVQLFDRFATYSGSSPYEASAVLSQIAHLEHHMGAFLPEGGMYQIVNALEKLVYECGVRVEKNAKVDRIILQGSTAKGVKVNGLEYLFDHVVCNADPSFAYRHLLDPKVVSKPESSFLPKSNSALVFYWGMNKTFDKLDVHNILFSKNYAKEFEEIFDLNNLQSDPTVYIYISSKTSKSDAPVGKENWFVMINVPYLSKEQDWDSLKQIAKKRILQKIKDVLGIDAEHFIETEEIRDPVYLNNNWLAHKGALYGARYKSWKTPFERHGNQNTKVNRLSFVGGAVHPGGGIPLCLKSAKIVAEKIGR